MNPPPTNHPDPYAQTVFHQVRLFPEDCAARRLAARLVPLRRLAQRDEDTSSVDNALCQFNQIETELNNPASRARHFLSAHATYRPSFTKLRQTLQALGADPTQLVQLKQADPEVIRRLQTRITDLINQLPALTQIDPALANLLNHLEQGIQI